MNTHLTVTGYDSDSSDSSTDTVVEFNVSDHGIISASDHDNSNTTEDSIFYASDHSVSYTLENFIDTVSDQDVILTKVTAIDPDELMHPKQNCDDNNNKVGGYLDLTITGRINLTSLDLDLVAKFMKFLEDGQIEARMFMNDIGESSTDTFEVETYRDKPTTIGIPDEPTTVIATGKPTKVIATGKPTKVITDSPTADLKKVENKKRSTQQQGPKMESSAASYAPTPEHHRHLQYYNAIQEPIIQNGNCSSSEDTLSVGSASSDSVETIPIRIRLPDEDIQKCLCFKPSETVWFAKQQVIASMCQDLKDTSNYGFYQPPLNGRAGKFLDEERLLRDYPMAGPVGYLEFKYKRRVYKQLNLDGSQIKKYNGRTYQKNIMDHIKSNSPDKVMKLIDKGLDPNFIEESSGETPLTLAATMHKSEEVIKMVLLGGYHHDFRNKCGLTAVHKAVFKGNARILEVILDLGASPNYKDDKGLTPLYYTAMHGGDPRIAEILMKDKATVNNVDSQGWSEIHQACRYGRVQHLEHLLFYGADIDAQNEAGNTGLHVCALYNHTPAARTLLFRGINKQLKNKANQMAHQVAIVANNTQLAEIIQDHAEDAVVMHRRLPQYTNRRRWTQIQGSLTRTTSEPLLPGSYSTLGRLGHRFPRQLSSIPLTDTISTASLDISDGSRALRASPVTTHMHPAQNGGIRYVAIKNYKAFQAGELTLRKGDIVEVTNKDDDSYWEGKVGNSFGLFPAYCVEKVVMRGKKVESDSQSDSSSVSGGSNYEHIFKTVTVKRGKKGFGFVLRGAKSKHEMLFKPSSENPALQYLDSVDQGSNAEKAGLKPGDFLLEINGEDVRQAEHHRVVQIVSKCPDALLVKVVTVEKTITPRTPSLDSHGSSKRRAPPPPLRSSKTRLSFYDEDSISIASDASSNSSQGSQKIASIRSRPTSKRVSSQHLDQILQRQGSKTSLLSTSSNPNKPVIPATPIFRYGTMGRNPKGTGEVVDNTLPRRSSNGSDSAHSSLRSSPASSYSLATDSSCQGSTDSGVLMKMERSASEHFTQYQSQPNAIPQKVPPALNNRSKSMMSLETASIPSAPEPKAKKAAPSPSPARALALREQKKRNSLTPQNPPPIFNPKTPPLRAKGVRSMSPAPAPPPPPPVDPPQNNNNMVNQTAKQNNKLTQDINANGSMPVRRKSDQREPNTFAASIARAAEKRKEQESPDVPSHAVQIALAARQRNMNQNNQSPNSQPSQSSVPPPTGLQAEILQRKAKLNSNSQSNETIEEKIKRQRENNVQRPKSTHDALLEAIAKRKSRLDQKEMEASSSESQSRQNSFEAWNEPTPTKPVKVPPSVAPKRNPNTKLSQNEGTQSRNVSPQLSKVGHNANFKTSTPKQNGLDNTDSRNQSALPPPAQFNAAQKGKNVENTQNNFSSILNRFQNSSPNGTINGHLTNDMMCVPPPPSNSENINQMVLEIVPPPPAMDINSRPQRLNRDHAFDTASVVSSMSSVSTLSNLSNEPWDSFQTIGEDDKMAALRPGNGGSQNSGSNKISNGPISTSFQASNSFQDKELSIWQPEDVADWLVSLKLGEYRDSFLENEISGEHLMALSKEDFTELGVTRIGHRLTIEKHLRKIRST